MRVLAVALAVVAALIPARQQPRIRWEWMKGPLYSPVRDILIHQGRLILMTPAAAWISPDAGRTWHTPPPRVASARQLAAADRDLYRDDVDRIERSSDVGQSWVACGPLPIDRRTGHEATSLAAYRERVYVSVQRLGLYGSTDRCRTWKKLSVPWASDLPGLVSYVRGDRIIARAAQGSFLSTDRGTSWIAIEARVPDALNFEEYCEGMILAGTGRGVYLSADGGKTWNVAGFEGRWVPAVTSPRCGIIHAAVKDEALWTYSVARSIDGGKTWTPWTDGLTPHPVYALSGAADDVVYAAGVAGVFRSSRGGPWEQFGPRETPVVGIAAAPWNSVFAATDAALFSAGSETGGWRMLLLGHDAHVSEDHPISSASAVTATSDGDLLASGRHGALLRSSDRGRTWRRAGLPHVVTAFASSSAGRTIFAATRTGVFRSMDRGESWTQQTTGLFQIDVLSVTSAVDGTLYAGTRSGDVFRSTTNADRWLPLLPVPGPVHALVATRNEALLAGTTFGCFKWRPDDRMWLPVQSAPPMRMVRAMIRHPTGAIVVATDGLGIFVSFDEGMTWTSANDGLSTAKVLSLAVGGDGLLYAGTSEGAFKAAM